MTNTNFGRKRKRFVAEFMGQTFTKHAFDDIEGQPIMLFHQHDGKWIATTVVGSENMPEWAMAGIWSAPADEY